MSLGVFASMHVHTCTHKHMWVHTHTCMGVCMYLIESSLEGVIIFIFRELGMKNGTKKKKISPWKNRFCCFHWFDQNPAIPVGFTRDALTLCCRAFSQCCSWAVLLALLTPLHLCAPTLPESLLHLSVSWLLFSFFP